MGRPTFSIHVTLDGCVDRQGGIADDEAHARAGLGEATALRRDRHALPARADSQTGHVAYPLKLPTFLMVLLPILAIEAPANRPQ